MAFQRLYTIRYEPTARRAIDDAAMWYPRLDDAVAALEFTLARDKSVGIRLGEDGVIRAAVLIGARSMGLPTVTVLYEVQDIFELIVIHSMRFEDGPTVTVH